jgi:wyosine [tRNA(Phe)-imidazoG37] synthetase (radical SAM superfamily)
MTPRVLDHHDHRRDLGDNRHVYAVVSRRAGGLSIGVNLNVDKVCNFDCPYCQVDRTPSPVLPTSEVDLAALGAELSRLLGWVRDGTLWEHPPFDTAAPAHRTVVDVAFAGDGEPTTAREFPAAVDLVRRLRDDFEAQVPVRLLTNGTMIHRPRVWDALPGVDEVWFKLDAGTEGYFQKVDGTTFPFRRILANLLTLAQARPVVIQAMFPALRGRPPGEREVDAWVDRLAAVRQGGGTIDHVQVYTVARAPADPTVGPLGAEDLGRIADAARAAGFRVAVHV